MDTIWSSQINNAEGIIRQSGMIIGESYDPLNYESIIRKFCTLAGDCN